MIGGEKKEEKLLVGMYITTGVTVRGEEDALHVHVATICRKDIQFCVNAKLHVVNTVHVCIMITIRDPSGVMTQITPGFYDLVNNLHCPQSTMSESLIPGTL